MSSLARRRAAEEEQPPVPAEEEQTGGDPTTEIEITEAESPTTEGVLEPFDQEEDDLI